MNWCYIFEKLNRNKMIIPLVFLILLAGLYLSSSGVGAALAEEIPLHSVADSGNPAVGDNMPQITAVQVTPGTLKPGEEKAVRVDLSTASVADGTALTVDLVGKDGSVVTGVTSREAIVQSDKAAASLTIPAVMGEGQYQVRVTLWGPSYYTGLVVTGGEEEPLLVRVAPSTVKQGGERSVRVDINTASLGDGTEVQVELVKEDGSRVSGVDTLTAVVQDGAASVDLSIPVNLEAGTYKARVTRGDSKYYAYMNVIAGDEGLLTVSAAPGTVKQGEEQNVAVDIQSAYLPDGTELLVDLVRENGGAVRGISPQEVVIQSGAAGAELTIPADLAAGGYKIRIACRKLTSRGSLIISKQSSGSEGETEVTVSVRVEGYDGTVVPRTMVTTDNFDLTPYLGPASGSSAGPSSGWGPDKLTKPTAAHALIKALESVGIDCTDHDDGLDLQDYGWSLYVSMIAGDREFDVKSTSGWLYRVNEVVPSYGCQQYNLQDGDDMIWYFGAYGFDSWYSELSASSTSAKTGEKITLSLSGQKSGLSGGKWENISDARIYVNGSEYSYNGKDVVTDQNGQAVLAFNSPGSYRVTAERFNGQGIRDMVRPMEINISITGESIESVSSNTADTVDEIGRLLESGSGDEAVLTQLIMAASQNLLNDFNNLADEEDAAKLVDNTLELTGQLENAAGIITSNDSALNFIHSCIDIMEVLAGVSEKISGEDNRQALSGASLDTLNALQAVLGAVDDRAELEAALEKMIGKYSSLPGQSSGEMRGSLINAVTRALAVICGGTVPEDKMSGGGGAVTAEVNTDWAAELAENAMKAIEAIETGLAENGITLNQSPEKTIYINIPPGKADKVEAVLEPGLMGRITDEGIERAVINLGPATFNLAPGIFGEIAEAGEITLSAAVANPSGHEKSVPPGSMVVVLGVKAGGRAIDSFQSPLEVSVPYRGIPQNPETVMVFLLKEDGSLEPAGGMYRPATGRVTFLADHPGQYFAGENIKSFKDMAGFAWAEEAVRNMAGKGIISGTEENSFEPAASVTRAEFASMVVRMLKCRPVEDGEQPFKDVAGESWYSQSVLKAYQNGLISGVAADRFDPLGYISREEMAAIIARVLSQKGYRSGNAEDLEAFADREDISPWAQLPASLAVREGIISGTADGRFAPKDRATRAEAAVMLYRLYGLVIKVS